MNSQQSKPILSAVFIDYDNIYLSLKRKSAVAARQFARAPGLWLREIEHGHLVSLRSDANAAPGDRRIVMNRSYGNPVPRRGGKDNATDMNSFPFVRHHFLRAGCEIVDCPPLTAQLKNSADIRMVMDIRDLLTHETRFDEFILLSGDSDFTPVLHRLRAHARRTIVYVNDHTAMPYTAIADGEIRESDLIALLEADGAKDDRSDHDGTAAQSGTASPQERAAQQDAILVEVVAMIRDAKAPVPIESLADRAQRKLGKDSTAGANWAGFGNFRAFLTACLPLDFRLTNEPPFLAFDPARHELSPATARSPSPGNTTGPAETARPERGPAQQSAAVSGGLNLQQAIGRIQEACQAPPLSPPEYSTVFEMIASEINEHGLNGNQTLTNIGARAASARVNIHPSDIRFVLDVVSEPDPWFEQGASASLFAGRFRNFVVTRCRTQGMELGADELELIDAWFAGATGTQQPARPHPAPAGGTGAESHGGSAGGLPPLGPVDQAAAVSQQPHGDQDSGRSADFEAAPAPSLNPAMLGDLADVDVGQLPRIVRSRMRT